MSRYRKKLKEEKPYAQKLIPLIIFAVISYTLANIALQIFKNVEISPTLTTCYFAFWGVEIINLAMIKFGKGKVRNSSDFGNIDTDELNEKGE